MKYFIIFVSIFILVWCGANKITPALQSDTDTKQKSEVEEFQNDLFVEEYYKIKDSYRQDQAFLSCINSSVETCLYDSIVLKSTQEWDVDICEDLKSDSLKLTCKNTTHRYNAIQQRDESLCNWISDNLWKHECRYIIISDKALENDDITMCDSISVNEYKHFVTDCQNLFTNNVDLGSGDTIIEGPEVAFPVRGEAPVLAPPF